jgi:hypothetical protein
VAKFLVAGTGVLQCAPDEAEDADLSKQFLKKLEDLRVCTVCGPNHRLNKSHARNGHSMRMLNDQEKAQEIAWYREIQADGEIARLRILDQRRKEAQSSKHGPAADPELQSHVERGVGGEYKLEFGKHAKKRLSHVLQAFPDYIPHMVNEKRFLGTQPFLQRALEEAGVMEQVKARASELRIEHARKAVLRDLEGSQVAWSGSNRPPRAKRVRLRPLMWLGG